MIQNYAHTNIRRALQWFTKGTKLTALAVLLTMVSCSPDEMTDTRPNILILLADDLGYSDLGCYGGEIETPNIDRLAHNGLRFTHFMNGTKCAASRASILTGLYPIETGCNGEPAQMINSVTIAEMLGSSGYRTMLSGKWHAEETPTKRGFDTYFGVTKGAFNYFNPRKNEPYMSDDKVLKPYVPENIDSFYTTDAFTDAALEFLEDTDDAKSPFFMMVSYNAPHWPLQAFPEDVEKYKGKYLQGWDSIRQQRFDRQRQMGLVKPNWKLSKRDENVPKWEDFDNKQEADLTMATYAAMIHRMDTNVGKLLKKLDDMNIADNTMVIFLSDNGGCAEGMMWDGKDMEARPGTKVSNAKLGQEWANVSNTPYRKFKRYMYNGGQLTPMIVRWPKEIPSKGKITHEKGHIIDIMPTLLQVADTPYPEGDRWTVPPQDGLLADWIVQPLSGKSLLPVFQNKTMSERSQFLGYFQGARMITHDSLKLVSDGSDGTVQHLSDYRWEVYDIENDATETNNIAAQHTDLIDSLDVVYREWIDKTDSLTGIKQHAFYQPRLTKNEQSAADELYSDVNMQALLKARKSLGDSIINLLRAMEIPVKTTLGMEKVPMAFYGIVESGRSFQGQTELLQTLYARYDDIIEKSRLYSAQKGELYLKVWLKHEQIRPKIPATDRLLVDDF